ncbi:ATP phosphoribosyltransferase [Aurantivibrio infirmus]
MNKLVIALTKGRILAETLPILEKAGIVPSEDISRSRKLIFETNQKHINLVILRGSDVPTYVEFGAADVGVAGKDTLMEHGGNGIYEPLDLGIARCRLMTAGLKMPSGTGVRENSRRIKVATKFVKTAKQYYAAQGRQADIIKLYGAMELAPLMNLADEIVDIVDTGNTLKANGLEPREHIANISTRIIVNKASMKMKHTPIQKLLDQLAAVL